MIVDALVIGVSVALLVLFLGMELRAEIEAKRRRCSYCGSEAVYPMYLNCQVVFERCGHCGQKGTSDG